LTEIETEPTKRADRGEISRRIRALAREMGVIVSLAPPTLSIPAMRTHVRRQLLPGQLKALCKASGCKPQTVLRALGTDPKRAGRPKNTERDKPTKSIDTHALIKWLMAVSKLREISSEASHALECAALGVDRGDLHANRNPYTGEPFK
jgi:hypothetical protein